jgi:hypothetical protein
MVLLSLSRFIHNLQVEKNELSWIDIWENEECEEAEAEYKERIGLYSWKLEENENNSDFFYTTRYEQLHANDSDEEDNEEEDYDGPTTYAEYLEQHPDEVPDEEFLEQHADEFLNAVDVSSLAEDDRDCPIYMKPFKSAELQVAEDPPQNVMPAYFLFRLYPHMAQN